MRKMNVEEMTAINGGVAFSTLCGWALYWWFTACAAGTAKSYLNRGKKRK